VGEILLLNKFFPIVDTCLSCEDRARQSCAMVRRWQFFASFLRPVFPASCMQHISDLHSKFTLGPHHVWKYGRLDIQSAAVEIIRGIKKDRKKPQGKNIMSASAMQGGRNKVKWQIHHDVSLSVKTQTYDSRNKPQIHHAVRSGIKNKCNFLLVCDSKLSKRHAVSLL